MINKTHKFHHAVTNLIILPLLFLAMLLMFGNTKAKASSSSLLGFDFPRLWGSVLGEDDEEDSEDSDREEDEDSDDDEDNNDDEDRDEDEDSDEEEDEDEFKTEIEDEFDSEEAMEILEETTNPDGTRTVKVMITEEDGDTEIKIITYDINGNIIDKREVDEDDSEHNEIIEVLETITNPDGTITKRLKITDEEGEVEFKLVTYDTEGNVIRDEELDDEDEDEDEDRDEEDDDIDMEGQEPTPEMILSLKNKLLESGISDSIRKLKIKVEDEEVEIKAQLVKDEKLFGIFKIEIPYDVFYNTGTDTIDQMVQSIWSKMLDLLTF